MKTTIAIRMFFGMVVTAALLACNLATPTAPAPVLDMNDLNTKVAGTFSAQLTVSAHNATPTPPPPEPTLTLEPPPIEPSAIPTQAPLATLALPSATPLPSFTPQSTVTPTSGVTQGSSGGSGSSGTPVAGGPGSQPTCLAAKFVKDVTVPDGTKYDPGKPFTKTWQIKNTGACAWTTDFQLVFARGDQMSGPNTQDLSSRVDPGETVNISVNLVSPVNAGEYRGNWMLANEDGARFGIGSSGNQTMWVEIQVKEIDEGIVFSFVEAYCSATWESDAGELKCPGKDGDDDGFVILLSTPDLENRKENEPALWVHPEQVKNGWISGTYPAIKVKDGDRFLADIGCLDEAENCDVIFQLNYRVNGGKVKNLGEWHEVFDGTITRVDVDLGDLSGKSVEFILTVEANGSFKEDSAFWLVPQIYR